MRRSERTAAREMVYRPLNRGTPSGRTPAKLAGEPARTATVVSDGSSANGSPALPAAVFVQEISARRLNRPPERSIPKPVRPGRRRARSLRNRPGPSANQSVRWRGRRRKLRQTAGLAGRKNATLRNEPEDGAGGNSAYSSVCGRSATSSSRLQSSIISFSFDAARSLTFPSKVFVSSWTCSLT